MFICFVTNDRSTGICEVAVCLVMKDLKKMGTFMVLPSRG